MKNIMLTILSVIMLISTAMAESITVVPGGKPGGSNFDRANLYKDVLTKMGHTVKFENISSTLESTKYLEKNTSETVIIMYAGNQPAQIGYHITDKNFILNEYTAPYFWCQSASSQSKDKLIVGLDKNMNQRFSDRLFKSLGKEVIYLKYKNSGDLYNAITAGDIDVMFTSQSASVKFIKNNQGSCLANTSDVTVENVPSVYTIVKTKELFPVMDYVVLSNKPSNQLREILLQANKDSSFVEWRNKKGLTEIVGTNSRKNELKIVSARQELWK